MVANSSALNTGAKLRAITNPAASFEVGRSGGLGAPRNEKCRVIQPN